MKATIIGSGPKKVEAFIPQEGHWYWCTAGETTWLCICARVNADKFAFICVKSGARWISEEPTLAKLGHMGMEDGCSFVPATVIINAE